MEHNNGDKNPSMAWDSNLLQMKCFTCNTVIDIYTLHNEYEGMSYVEVLEKYGLAEEKKPANVPKFNLDPLTDQCIKYIEKRGISLNTITHFKTKKLQRANSFSLLSV